jgi:hypothetical protein
VPPEHHHYLAILVLNTLVRPLLPTDAGIFGIAQSTRLSTVVAIPSGSARGSERPLPFYRKCRCTVDS